MNNVFQAIFDGAQFGSFIIFLVLGLFYILVSGVFSLAFGDSGDGHDGDMGGHEGSAEHHEPISIFSPRVIAIFFVGFGAAGSLASHYGLGVVAATVWALIGGSALGALMFVGMRALYKQQSHSNVSPSDAVGLTGQVVTTIPFGGTGEVSVSVRGQYMTYSAQSVMGINRGTTVKIISSNGSILVVQ